MAPPKLPTFFAFAVLLSLPPLLLLFAGAAAGLSPSLLLENNGGAGAALPFDEGFSQIFGESNLAVLRNGQTVHISLDERTGAGFSSQDSYLHGFFSAAVKLPANHTAGVVVAFYMSNGNMYEKTHDELDFEFLGNVKGKEWRLQTNVYGNGSTSTGREERYKLWFDPADDFHQYSILWTHHRITFFVDEVPIRQVARNNESGGGSAFPSKPMNIYATIWDGSGWATDGGRHKVDYKHAPFVAEFTGLIISGTGDSLESAGAMSREQRAAMEGFRKKHMSYSYCHDQKRYPAAPPECPPDARLAGGEVYGLDGVMKFGDHRRRRRSGGGGGSRIKK